MKTRNLLFADAEEFQKKIDYYFEEYLNYTNEIADVESICDYLQIDRKTLLEYENCKKKTLDENVAIEISNTIKRAKVKIAKIKKQLALRNVINAAIFCFDFKNNHDYVDKQEIDTKQNINVENNISHEEKMKKIEEYNKKIEEKLIEKLRTEGKLLHE